MSPGFLPSPGSGPWRCPPRRARAAARAGAARFNRGARGRPRLGERPIAISARGGALRDVRPRGGADWSARPSANTCPPAIGPWRSRSGGARGGTVSRRVRRRWPCACPRYRGQPGHGEERELPGLRHSASPRVLQVLDSQYGMYVWPCAVVLAQYLWAHRRSLPGKRVLEVPHAPRPVPPLVTRGPGSARSLQERAMVSDRCRCESPGRGGRQVRCPGDPVGQRGAAPVPAELPQQLPHEPPAPRARPRPHLGPGVARAALSCSYRHYFRLRCLF